MLEDKKKTWTYGTRHEQLTTNLILSWACTWNTPGQDYPKLPDHEETNPALAQIRVKFDSEYIKQQLCVYRSIRAIMYYIESKIIILMMIIILILAESETLAKEYTVGLIWLSTREFRGCYSKSQLIT